MQGLSEFRVASAADVISLVERGSKNRTTRATEANTRSSRSHAILTLSLEVESDSSGEKATEADDAKGRRKAKGAVRTVLRRAKLNLVDLAGSEKVSARRPVLGRAFHVE